MQKKDVKNIIIIFIIVLILELIVFNINSYRVLNSKNARVFKKDSFEYLDDLEIGEYIKINDINEEIKTIHVEFKNADCIDYVVSYTDETTSILQDLPSKTYIENLPRSKYIATYLSRKK